MKKILSILLVLIILIVGVSCSKKKCDICGSTENVRKVEGMGQTGYLCENCYAATFGAAQNAMGMMNSLGLSTQN